VGEHAEAVSNEVFWHGWTGNEPETASVFWELARTATCVIDVGAHVGYYSLIAGHANPNAHVVAFEALPHVADRLGHHVALNGLGNVTIERAAVGREVGVGTMWYTTAIPVPSSSGLAGEFVRQNEMVTSVEVPMTTLDAYVREQHLGRVDLVKIDTETTEPDVIAGARETLERDHPVVVCEVLPGDEVADLLNERLEGLDYRAALLTDRGAIGASRIVGDDRWRNWLLTPS
jgi:FkbM family methyltransferase